MIAPCSGQAFEIANDRTQETRGFASGDSTVIEGDDDELGDRDHWRIRTGFSGSRR
jgi:hypothetical protein